MCVVPPVEFSEQYFGRISECINSDKNPYSSEARASMNDIIVELKTKGYCVREGDDNLRIPFVGIQGAMEHVLAAFKASQIVPNILGAIHTPTPATPLCALADGKNIQNLMDPSIWDNADKRATVTERAVSIRLMLSQKGTLFYAIFAKGGMEKRKPEEQQIFQEETANYKDSLRVSELPVQIDPAFVGAIYYFTDGQGQEYAISIKAQQANAPQAKSVWGIWFGALANPEIAKREQEVSTYVTTQGGPDLHKEFVDLCLKNAKSDAH